jgi:hypothetical protein
MRGVWLFILILLTSVLGLDQASACNELNTCQHINWCAYIQLDHTNDADREKLLTALQHDDPVGEEIYTHNCQKHYGFESNWTTDSAGCNSRPKQFIYIARNARDNHCAAYFGPPPPPPGRTYYCRINGQTYALGTVATGFGVCRGPTTVGAPCDCGGSPGQVQ